MSAELFKCKELEPDEHPLSQVEREVFDQEFGRLGLNKVREQFINSSWQSSDGKNAPSTPFEIPSLLTLKSTMQFFEAAEDLIEAPTFVSRRLQHETVIGNTYGVLAATGLPPWMAFKNGGPLWNHQQLFEPHAQVTRASQGSPMPSVAENSNLQSAL